MKKFIVLILLLIPALAGAKENFPEVTDELEARQFWAQSYFKPGSNIAVMKFRVWFHSTPDKVFKILTDTNKLKDQLSNFSDSRALTKQLFKQIIESSPHSDEDVVKVIGKNKITSSYNRQRGQNWTDYIYFKFNFPWPLSDRWTVQKVRVDETNHKKGEYKYEYKMHVGNFKTLSGYWELLPVSGRPGWTEFRGRYESNPGVAVPKFITKKAMVSGLKKDVGAYRKVLGK